MSNPLGNLFNREAQNLTAEIEHATNSDVKDQGDFAIQKSQTMERTGRQVTEAINGHTLETADNRLTEFGPVSAEGESRIPEENIIQEAEELARDEARLEGRLDFASEVTPEVESEKEAHERNLARAEGEMVLLEPKISSVETATSLLEPEIPFVDRENAVPQQNVVKNINTEVEDGLEPINLGLANSETSISESLDAEPPVSGQTAYSSLENPTFVHNERAIAEGTMEAVDRVVTGKKDPKLVDILALYEKSANAMQDLDRGAV